MVSVIGVAFIDEQFLPELKIDLNPFTDEVRIKGAPLNKGACPAFGGICNADV